MLLQVRFWKNISTFHYFHVCYSTRQAWIRTSVSKCYIPFRKNNGLINSTKKNRCTNVHTREKSQNAKNCAVWLHLNRIWTYFSLVLSFLLAVAKVGCLYLFSKLLDIKCIKIQLYFNFGKLYTLPFCPLFERFIYVLVEKSPSRYLINGEVGYNMLFLSDFRISLCVI